MKHYMLLVLTFASMLLVGCSGSGGKVGTFNERSLVYDGQTRLYRVYTPVGYNPKTKYPTVVFLHGLFEGGSDGESQTKVGIGKAIRNDPERFPCIVIFPQTSGDWKQAKSWPLAMATVDDAIKNYSVDQDRMVLTGLSNGGFGTWRLGAMYSNRWAAIMPMCAHEDKESVSKLTRLPIWAHHNKADTIVSCTGTRNMVANINSAGGSAKGSYYGGFPIATFGHNCWDEAYGNKEVVTWMLSQRRK